MESLEANQMIEARESRMLYVIHGEISIHYLSHGDLDDYSFPSTLIKTLSANDFSVLFDLDVDIFSSKRNYQMRIKASSAVKFLSLSQNNLLALLKELNSPEFGHFIQARSSFLSSLTLSASLTCFLT
jgi:hypothetical protein